MRLAMLIGIPGSGKSTFAKERLSGVYLSSDDLRDTLKKVDIWEEMHALTRLAFKQGKDVIFDATNIKRDNRAEVLSIAHEFGAYTEAYVFEPPVAKCLRQNKERRPDRIVPEEVIWRMLKQYEPPTGEEGFNAIHSV